MVRVKEPKIPIKVGDYVRIKYMGKRTKIGRIIQILDKDTCYHNMQMYLVDVGVKHSNSDFESSRIYEEDIIDYSSEIIKLVEIGDYVNGCKVIDKYYSYRGKELLLDAIRIEGHSLALTNIDIQSILTKESFDTMNYVIGKLSK